MSYPFLSSRASATEQGEGARVEGDDVLEVLFGGPDFLEGDIGLGEQGLGDREVCGEVAGLVGWGNVAEQRDGFLVAAQAAQGQGQVEEVFAARLDAEGIRLQNLQARFQEEKGIVDRVLAEA